MNRPAGPRVTWLSPEDPPEAFPELAMACREPEGLLAAGGDLSEARLLHAYKNGIFPWYSDGEPILWWSPDPRCVMRPDAFHVARRLRRSLTNSSWEVTFNRAFDDVIRSCAGQRLGQHGTWITAEMNAAYHGLHHNGWAHSVEVWDGETLVGGIYGLAIGKVFFGESMFSRADNASKIAMLALTSELSRSGIELLDCQVESAHLMSLGAGLLTRQEFSALLQDACEPADPYVNWPRARSLVASLL